MHSAFAYCSALYLRQDPLGNTCRELTFARFMQDFFYGFCLGFRYDQHPVLRLPLPSGEEGANKRFLLLRFVALLRWKPD